MLPKQLQRISTLAHKQAAPIDLPKLQAQFRAHFQKELENYQVPLLAADGLLSYTTRFAKTVINQTLSDDEREGHFLKIKRSLNSPKSFTVQSSVDACESLINFRFEGEENRIFEKLRAFAKLNERRFTSKQADRFNTAYKFLMADRANGPIKFKDFKVDSPKTDKQHLEEIVRMEVRSAGKGRVEWEKKEVGIEVEVGGVKKTVKIMGWDEAKGKDDDIEVQAGKVLRAAQRQNEAIIIHSTRPNRLISKEVMAQNLLIKPSFYGPLSEAKDMGEGYACRLIALLNKNSNSKVNVSTGSDINYLNYILEASSTNDLKEMFGYAKLNLFHIEYQRLMLMINKARKTTVPRLEPLDYMSLFEQEEREHYKMLTLDDYNARAVGKLLQDSKGKSVAVFCNERKVAAIVRSIARLGKESIEEQKQNRIPEFLFQKLAICSVLYQMEIQLPSLKPYVTRYRKILHPLTCKYHY